MNCTVYSSGYKCALCSVLHCAVLKSVIMFTTDISVSSSELELSLDKAARAPQSPFSDKIFLRAKNLILSRERECLHLTEASQASQGAH